MKWKCFSIFDWNLLQKVDRNLKWKKLRVSRTEWLKGMHSVIVLLSSDAIKMVNGITFLLFGRIFVSGDSIWAVMERGSTILLRFALRLVQKVYNVCPKRSLNLALHCLDRFWRKFVSWASNFALVEQKWVNYMKFW